MSWAKVKNRITTPSAKRIKLMRHYTLLMRGKI